MRFTTSLFIPILTGLSAFAALVPVELNPRYDGDASIAPLARSESQELALRELDDLFPRTTVPETDLAVRGTTDLSTLEARNPLFARIAVQVVKNIIKGIIDGVNADIALREEFTRRFISDAWHRHPEYNWVICHTSHTASFDGRQGDNWGHMHEEVDIQIGGTVGYEIYWAESGEFARHGDGGFRNWAYHGRNIHRSNDGKLLRFNKP